MKIAAETLLGPPPAPPQPAAAAASFPSISMLNWRTTTQEILVGMAHGMARMGCLRNMFLALAHSLTHSLTHSLRFYDYDGLWRLIRATATTTTTTTTTTTHSTS